MPGVVAVITADDAALLILDHGCRAPLRPQGDVSNNRKLPAGARNHLGEGLCEQCYPRLARAVRNPPPPAPKRSYQQNNPINTQ